MLLGISYTKGDKPDKKHPCRFKNIPLGHFIPGRIFPNIDRTKEEPNHEIKEIHSPDDKIMAFYDTQFFEHGYHKDVSFYVALRSVLMTLSLT